MAFDIDQVPRGADLGSYLGEEATICLGEAGARLGLNAAPDMVEINRVFAGRHPQTNERLRKGKETDTGGWHSVGSAPLTYSYASLATEELGRSFRKSMPVVWREFESRCTLFEDSSPGRLRGMVFMKLEEANRLGEPNLHGHFGTPALFCLPDRTGWRVPDTQGPYGAQGLLGSMIHNDLARAALGCGLHINDDGEILEVADVLGDIVTQRRKDILEEMQKLAERYPKAGRRKLSHMAALITRPTKDPSRHEEWRSQNGLLLENLERVISRARLSAESPILWSNDQVLDNAFRLCGESRLWSSRDQVLEAGFRSSLGHVDRDSWLVEEFGLMGDVRLHGFQRWFAPEGQERAAETLAWDWKPERNTRMPVRHASLRDLPPVGRAIALSRETRLVIPAIDRLEMPDLEADLELLAASEGCDFWRVFDPKHNDDLRVETSSKSKTVSDLLAKNKGRPCWMLIDGEAVGGPARARALSDACGNGRMIIIRAIQQRQKKGWVAPESMVDFAVRLGGLAEINPHNSPETVTLESPSLERRPGVVRRPGTLRPRIASDEKQRLDGYVSELRSDPSLRILVGGPERRRELNDRIQERLRSEPDGFTPVLALRNPRRLRWTSGRPSAEEGQIAVLRQNWRGLTKATRFRVTGTAEGELHLQGVDNPQQHTTIHPEVRKKGRGKGKKVRNAPLDLYEPEELFVTQGSRVVAGASCRASGKTIRKGATYVVEDVSKEGVRVRREGTRNELTVRASFGHFEFAAATDGPVRRRFRDRAKLIVDVPFELGRKAAQKLVRGLHDCGAEVVDAVVSEEQSRRWEGQARRDQTQQLLLRRELLRRGVMTDLRQGMP